MKKLLALSALAFVLSTSYGFADHHERGEGHKGGKGKLFEHADTNGDGAISQSEFKAHQDKKAEEWFNQLDQDGNGSVTKEEAKAGREKMRDQMKKRRGKRKASSEGSAE